MRRNVRPVLEANVLAYIDGFEFCFGFAVAALLLISLITRAPQGTFTPDPTIIARGWGMLWPRASPLLRGPD